MSQLKSSTRLFLLVGVLSCLLLVISSLGLLGIRQSNDALKTVYQDRTVAIGLLSDVQHQLLRSRLLIDASVLDPRPQVIAKNLAELSATSVIISKTWASYMATYITPEEEKLAAKFEQDYVRFEQEGLLPAVAALRVNDIASVQNLIREKILPLDAKLQLALEDLMQIQLNVAKLEYQEAVGRYALVRKISIGAIGGGVLFAILSSLALMRARRQELAVLLERQAHADLARQIQEKNELLQALERQKQDLAESEFRWRFAIEGGGDGVWDRDLQTGQEKHSRRWKEMLGYSEDEILPDHQEWESRIHPDDRQGVLASDADYIAGKAERYEVEYRLRCKDGSYKWILSRGIIVSRDQSGKPLRTIGTHTDISERKKTEAQLAAAHAELARQSEERAAELVVANDELTFQNEEKGKRAAELVVANDELTFQNEEKGKRAVELTTARDEADLANLAKSQFLASMSHEIRTPMNGIMGMAQVLRKTNLSESDRIDYADTIYKSGQTLMSLLNDILDLSKIEAGKVELETVALMPSHLLADIRTLFAQAAKAKGLKIDAHWSGAPRQYLGDQHRLRQMLSNLVGNALKFTEHGLIRIEAREVSSTQDTAILEFSVSDSGIGVAKDKQALLFETFKQVDSTTTRRYGGTGLGLSIVRTLAQLMGGEAGVHSELGQGSRFWFRVTLKLASAATSLVPDDAFHAADTPSQLVTLRARVLVVEDNPVNQKVIGIFLQQLGVSTVLAPDGQQALDRVLAGDPFDLILMDMEMPVLDGYGATKRIRQWEQDQGQARRTIIALTAGAFEEDRLRCLAAGTDEVLTKPIEFEHLTATLCKWLPETVQEVASSPGATASHKALDTARVRNLIHDLYPMLENNQVDAIARFKDLQEAVTHTPLELPVAQAGASLQNFEFEAALAQLKGIVVPP